jgi:general secretion pathway protein I
MKNKAGFTLIEVLVALAILSIALTAIIKASAQNIKDTTYIQQKTLALWIANEIANEARAGLLILPKSPDVLTEEKVILGQAWTYQADVQDTPNPRIKKMDVDILAEDKQTPLVHLESFLYAQPL